jgi:hypothetical protein
MSIPKIIPISILTVGCSALTFQTTILHPYHNEIDHEFKQLMDLEEQDQKFQEF